MDIDIDELTRKTFEISKSDEHCDILAREKDNSPFNNEVLFDIEEDLRSQDSLPLAPVGPGLIFKLEKGAQTFCIRGFATESIEQSLLDIESGEVSSRARLKFESEEDFDFLNFFEINSLELANKIQLNLFNRRFPLDETLVCNLSDPGFSWWLEDHEKGFEMFFQNSLVFGQNRFYKLGPLGDHLVATDIMRMSELVLRKFFPINEFSCDEKGLKIIPCDPENLAYMDFLNLIYRGDRKFLDQFFPANKNEQNLFNYLEEVATMRLFWLNVEEILEEG